VTESKGKVRVCYFQTKEHQMNRGLPRMRVRFYDAKEKKIPLLYRARRRLTVDCPKVRGWIERVQVELFSCF
jgi:hypothetical protein